MFTDPAVLPGWAGTAVLRRQIEQPPCLTLHPPQPRAKLPHPAVRQQPDRTLAGSPAIPGQYRDRGVHLMPTATAIWLGPGWPPAPPANLHVSQLLSPSLLTGLPCLMPSRSAS